MWSLNVLTVPVWVPLGASSHRPETGYSKGEV